MYILFGCLERDNIWDPINMRDDTIAVADSLDSLENLAWNHLIDLDQEFEKLSQELQKYTDSLTIHAQSQKEIRLVNNKIETDNSTNHKNNELLDTTAGISCYTLKILLSELDSLIKAELAMNTDSLKLVIQVYKSQIDSIVSVTQSWMDSNHVIVPAVRDSLVARWDNLTNGFNVLQSNEDSLDQVYDLANVKVDSLNSEWANINVNSVTFNTAVRQSENYCSRPLVEPVLIRQSIPNLGPGDTLFIGNGIIDFTNFEVTIHVSGTVDSPIVLYAHPESLTVFTSSIRSPFIIDNQRHMEIVNISFMNSAQSGATVLNESDSISFINCQFNNNKEHGLDVLDTDIRLINCRFLNNLQNGVRIHSSAMADESVYIDNVLIAGNGENGIFGLTIRGEILNATISDNGRDGIFLEVPQTDVTLRRSLVTYNSGYGVVREQIPAVQGILEIEDCNLYMNTSGNLLSDPPYDSLLFQSANPLYLDKVNGDYRLDSTSSFKAWGYQFN